MLERFSLHDDFSAAYRQYGYVVLTDLFTADEVRAARQELLDLFAHRFQVAGVADSDGDELLVRYYEADRERWRQCAQRMQDLLGPIRMAVKPQIEAALLGAGLQAPMIGTRPEVRTDMPADQQYMQPWHQDWRSGQGSINSVTIWVPLQDVSAHNGAIELLPGSHFLGCCEVEELPNPRRFLVVDPRIESWEREVAELEVGEAVLFSQLLVHRSGHNSSGRPRITMQLRYSDYAEPGFAARGYPKPSGSELVWNTPPTASEVEAAFVA